MRQYKITGGKSLFGEVEIHGAKNSVLPILAATILAKDVSTIHHCPRLSDVMAMVEILKTLGCRVTTQEDSITVDARELCAYDIPLPLMQTMRSYVLLLGPLLGRLGKATMGMPGGCNLGPRPIDMHITALSNLGMTMHCEDDTLHCSGKRMYGSRISLPFPSVGATENAMMVACGIEGITRIENAAREPEIVDLQGFLRSMGAKIWGAGSGSIYIEGGTPLRGGNYKVMPDRIVTASYLAMVASAGGEVALLGAEPRHILTVIRSFQQAGVKISGEKEKLVVQCEGKLRGISPIYTAPYPSFPTDAQPMLMAALCKARGRTVFVETIFKERYSYVEGLCAMGADIRRRGQRAELFGRGKLSGAEVEATDLRGGAALVVAALGAEGESGIGGLQYIERGYENLAAHIRRLGGDIREERDDLSS